MTTEDGGGNKGFSGLGSLLSDVSTTESAAKRSIPKKPVDDLLDRAQKHRERERPQSTASNTHGGPNATRSPDPKTGSGFKTIFWVTVIVIVVGWLANDNSQPERSSQNNAGETRAPLRSRILESDLPGVNRLLQSGADVNAVDSDGNTSLHVAAFVGNTQIISVLKSHGADIFRVNNGALTAADVAKNQGQSFAYELLREDYSNAIKAIQEGLYNLGYNPGQADGIFGSKTANAIKQMQENNSMTVDGKPSMSIFRSLNGASRSGPWGALAYNWEGAHSSSTNRPNRKQAALDAMQFCNEKGYECFLAEVWDNYCVSFARNEQGAGAVRYAISKKEAEQLSVKACNESGTNCAVRVSICANGKSQLTMDIQGALSALGYEPGVADGIFGRETKAAIETFQRETGSVLDGRTSQQLLESMKKELDKRRAQGANAQKLVPTQSPARNQATEPTNRFFTRGSHQDDVLRLQGAPANFSNYKALGYEDWHFGRSTVKIDLRTKRVLEWNNKGNLKVELRPGNQTTSARAFTRGSHQDDVLRLQGAPANFRNYKALGYEDWHFGRSTVKIDLRTRRVLEWNNKGNLKVELRPGNQTTSARAFTRGSHQDDVLRLQGAPANFRNYKALGYEDWHFGRSTVKIDLRTRRVLEWNNKGNLKVELRPGNQTTSARAFTRGSHQDDVLRLQGAPANFSNYKALGYEDWHFGRSTVKIDLRTRRVLEWNNKGNLKVAL